MKIDYGGYIESHWVDFIFHLYQNAEERLSDPQGESRHI